MNSNRRRRIEGVIDMVQALLAIAVIVVALGLAGYVIGTLI